MKKYIAFTCDWESRGDYSVRHLSNGIDHFEPISRYIIGAVKDILDGKMTWYAKIDFFADITYYNSFDELASEILSSGGELGVHIHHISRDPFRRAQVYSRATKRMVEAGFPVTAYSAGNGEVLPCDTELLINSGFKTSRWGYPGLKHQYADWTDMDYAPGYVRKDNYKRTGDSAGLFVYQLGTDYNNNDDGLRQLHIRSAISLNMLKKVFTDCIERLLKNRDFPLLGCYFHPYNLCTTITECDTIDTDAIKVLSSFVSWLINNDVYPVLDNQARTIFNSRKQH